MHPLLGSPTARRELEDALSVMHHKVRDAMAFLDTPDAARLPIATQLELRGSNILFLEAEAQLRRRLSGGQAP